MATGNDEFNSSRYGKLKIKSIHGVETGNHSNPNVLKAARCYKSGGKVADMDGDMDDDDMGKKGRGRSGKRC